MRLAGNTGRKNRHPCTITQLCRAISLQLRRVSTIGKKIVKQQYLPNMPLQYGKLRPTNGWDLLASLGHPSTFQRVSRLGSVTARHSNSGRQPNFAALNRGRHLYLTGRLSRWALAYILVLCYSLFVYVSMHHHAQFGENQSDHCRGQTLSTHYLWTQPVYISAPNTPPVFTVAHVYESLIDALYTGKHDLCSLAVFMGALYKHGPCLQVVNRCLVHR